MDVTVVIFLLTYAALAIGRIPGFRVDRTGAVLLGAIALIVTGRIGLGAAWNAVNFGAIALLFGLMVVSATFVLSGFYDWAAAGSRAWARRHGQAFVGVALCPGAFAHPTRDSNRTGSL
jgi:Na+/H+ antiporter NhaD/arsenite permease-like protein